jgi:hypothetical protein
MAASAGARLRNGCLSVGSLGVVIAGLLAIDDTCRRFALDALHGQLPDAVLGFRLHHITAQVAAIVPADNAGMLVFAGTAFVLFVAMFRS